MSHAPKSSRPRRRTIQGSLWVVATAAILVAWEYGWRAAQNPQVEWSGLGILAHGALDLGFVAAVVALAFAVSGWAARRLDLSRRSADGLLGRAGLACLAFLVLTVALQASRDPVHEWFGTRFEVSLARAETTVVSSDLTVRDTTELCSFGALSSRRAASDDPRSAPPLAAGLAASASASLPQLAVFLPLVLVGGLARYRHRLSRADLAPLRALMPAPARATRLAVITAAVAVIALLAVGESSGSATVPAAPADLASLPIDACQDGGEVIEYSVSAIDVVMTLNRWGDHVEGASMYALDANIPAIRAFEADLESDRTVGEGLGVARVSHGLRRDPIQPLVLRANLGQCLRVHFTNRLEDGEPASVHILGLAHSAQNAGSAVGYNPDSFAQPGETVTYEIPLPLDPEAERAYYFHDHGAGRRRQNMGLFGAIVVEPRGSVYLDVETGEQLDPVTGSNWEAIILDPNLDGREDGKSFREFVIFYHEIGDEGFTEILDSEGKKVPLIDDVTKIYRPAARALNYRSEPFRRRLEIQKKFKSLGYSSYPFGDPGTPIPRSYVGEGVKTRLLHGGSEVFHVHHLHGGGDRWRRNPNADPNNDFWKGLTKIPDPNLTSIHLDSQSIGPGTSYNLEHECGAGGCQQGVGDFLYHCHIGHHYLSGMWAFWRVFGTVQTAQTNVYGRPLAAVPELFQNPTNPLMAPSAPADAVSAGGLLGLVVDGGRVLVPNALLTDPSTQIGLGDWVAGQLPPPGARIDSFDATTWDWISTEQGAALRVWGEPESADPFPGYVSAIPGVRPEVLFNPKNGRYVWPLFRPHKGERPPFSARHSGAPWLGEEMREGRLDGLCAVNGVDPAVDVGDAVKRFYPVSSITLPIGVTSASSDPDGMIFVLNEDEAAVRAGDKPAEPLAVRSNVGDCVELLLTNKIPDGPLNQGHSKTNMHSHFVQFDTQASDGVITGFSYEQSVRPIASEGRRLTASIGAAGSVLSVNHTERLRPGVWIGIGLGEGVCGFTDQGQSEPCTEVRQIVALTDDSITLDRALEKAHAAGEAVGVEFVRYNWYPDVDFGTVFFHTHVEFKDWDHGLFGAHVVEPRGSSYHDPESGEEVRSGTLVDVRVDPAAGGNPVAAGVAGSFREFMLFLHNNSPAEGSFQRGGGTINLRAEPWRLRPGDAAYRFSSVLHGDPSTPLVRAYVGDPVVVRGLGLVERVGGVRFTGHRFQKERYSAASDTRDATFLGISERFDISLEGGAGGPAGYAGDYLYYSTLGRDFEAGAWGLLRVHDSGQPSLQPLPGRAPPAAGPGFPDLAFTGEAPRSLGDGPGEVCPDGAPSRFYVVEVSDRSVIYGDLSAPDPFGVVYHLRSRSEFARSPLVLRANAGDCLRVRVKNSRQQRGSLSLGELLFDPQRSYGSAIGYNHDSTTLPGRSRLYEYYADRELGLVLGLNLADVDSVARGAYAGVVIEPEGATYRRPGSAAGLPAGGSGIQADIVVDGEVRREFVALFSDEDRRIGQNTMPYPTEVERFAGINYAAEPLDQRDLENRPAEVFRSELWGDPRYVVEVPAGTPLVYRVGHAWGEQPHVPTLEGHRWRLEPGLVGSEQVFNDVLAPGMTLDLHFVGGAGGEMQAPGDYLFLDRRQPFMEHGLWNLLRVTGAEHGAAPSDSVAIRHSEIESIAASSASGGGALLIEGSNGVRPAGDTARKVWIHAGPVSGRACSGPLLGEAAVDPGSGRWRFSAEVAQLPDIVCVRSAGGGLASFAMER